MTHDGTSYYVVMTDNDTKSGNVGSHFEFQDCRLILNNTRLNHIYDNEGNYLLYTESQNMAENVIFARLSDSHFEFQVKLGS